MKTKNRQRLVELECKVIEMREHFDRRISLVEQQVRELRGELVAMPPSIRHTKHKAGALRWRT